MAVFQASKWANVISRKIWVAGKSLNFHTVSGSDKLLLIWISTFVCQCYTFVVVCMYVFRNHVLGGWCELKCLKELSAFIVLAFPKYTINHTQEVLHIRSGVIRYKINLASSFYLVTSIKVCLARCIHTYSDPTINNPFQKFIYGRFEQ